MVENLNVVGDAEFYYEPIITGNDLNVSIYNCLDLLSNSCGEVINEYHWREFCGLMKQMEDEKMVNIEFKKVKIEKNE